MIGGVGGSDELVLQPVPFGSGSSVSAPAQALAQHFRRVDPRMETVEAQQAELEARIANLEPPA